MFINLFISKKIIKKYLKKMSEKKEILEESKKIIEKYKLLPHVEGGYFIELYSSSSLLK